MRKITIDNSVKYSPQGEQTKERDIKPNTMKNRKQDKRNISQKFNKFLKDTMSGEGFRMIK